MRVPLPSRRSKESILKEINPEYSLEGLKLKLQYFAHLMQRADSLEKTLMLGKIEGRRRRGDRPAFCFTYDNIHVSTLPSQISFNGLKARSQHT